jgi:hypothetical protein
MMIYVFITDKLQLFAVILFEYAYPYGMYAVE